MRTFAFTSLALLSSTFSIGAPVPIRKSNEKRASTGIGALPEGFSTLDANAASAFASAAGVAAAASSTVVASAAASSAGVAAAASAPSTGIGALPQGFSTIAGDAASQFASAAGVAAAAASSSVAAADTTSAAASSEAAATSSAAESSAAAAETTAAAESSAAADSSSEAAATSTSAAAAASSSSSSSDSSSSSSDSDAAAAAQNAVVLNLAITLENLETTFYQTGLSTFSKGDMINAGLTSTQADILIQTFSQQLVDEGTHLKTLTSTLQALGGTPNTACQFDFSSVLTNPATFISAARTIELVGVSAYAGAANLVSDPTVLTAAATILSIEGRHQSGLNLFSGGTFTPQSFDFALRPEQVLAVAGAFLKGCAASDLGLTANQPLSAVDAKTGTSLITKGTQLAFASPILNSDTDASKLTCQMLVTGQPVAIVQPLSNCVVPEVNGPVMIYVSNDTVPLQANIIEQNTAQIIAGPAPVFIDDSSETFQQLFSIQGFGISTLASLDMGSILMDQSKKVDIITESTTTTVIKETVESGMIVANSKRGYQSPEGAKILGWH